LARALTMLKLGGSVITDKKRAFAASKKRISRLMKEIRASMTESLIIVHGGGSFGHHLARRYRLREGYRDRSQILGLVRTRQSMTELNKIVLDSAIENYLPCVSLQPSAFIGMRNKRIERMDLSIIVNLLDLRMIPLLFGDVAFDEQLRFSILSGDQLTSRLATELSAEQAILAVDVDGVFDSDPKRSPKAKLMQKMTAEDVRMLIQRGGKKSQSPDVTGGMVGKLSEVLPAVEKGIRVMIVNGCVPGRVSEALKGRPTTGTVIEL